MAPPESPSKIELGIDSRLEDVALVGVAVGAIAGLLGYDESERFSWELCVVEAASNSIRHAYAMAAGHPVRVRIEIQPSRVEIRVADQGLPVPLDRRRPPEPSEAGDPGELAESGRGIPLMHQLMDEVEFGEEEGWNVVTLAKRRPSPLA